MNEIVSDTGMIRVLRELGIEDRRRFQGARIAFVPQRLACREIERAENLRLIVVVVAGGQGLERIGKRAHAGCLRPLGEAFVKRRDRLDIVAFALRLGADRAPALDGSNGALGVLGRWPERERIADQDRRDPPRGDGAGRVAVERFAECFFAGRKGEGMEKRDTALETLLRFGRAGICKGDGAEFFVRGTGHRCRGGAACGQRAEREQKNKHKRKKACAAHR